MHEKSMHTGLIRAKIARAIQWLVVILNDWKLASNQDGHCGCQHCERSMNSTLASRHNDTIDVWRGVTGAACSGMERERRSQNSPS